MSLKSKPSTPSTPVQDRIDVPLYCKQIIQQYSNDTARIQSLEDELKITKAELKKAFQIIEQQKQDLRVMHQIVATNAKSAQEALKTAERSLNST